jgi:hypothetical protein
MFPSDASCALGVSGMLLLRCVKHAEVVRHAEVWGARAIAPPARPR